MNFTSINYGIFKHADAIKELAKCFTLPQDVAIIIEVETSELIKELNDLDSVIRRSYFAGFLETQVTIKKKVVENTADVELIEIQLKELSDFKAKLIIQLNA